MAGRPEAPRGVRRGEVWWVEAPDIAARPHLILTRDEAIATLQRLIAVPATRTIRGIATEVSLGPADGLAQECVLSCDNIRVVEKSYFTHRITALHPAKLNAVCKALAAATACN